MAKFKVCLAVAGVMCAMLSMVPVARADVLYVSDTGANAVRQLDTTSGTVTPLSTQTTTAPQGIAVNVSNTTTYVTNTTGNTLSTINNSTGTVSSFITTNLSSPVGVAVDGSGNIYIVNSGNSTVREYNSGGTFIQSINTNSGTNTLTNPQYVAVDSAGNIYVSGTTSSGSGVNKYNSAGALQGSANGFGNAEGLKIAPSNFGAFGGQVFVVDAGVGSQGVDRITAFNGTGGSFSSFTTFGTAGTVQPNGLAFDNTGTMYVSNKGTTGPQIWKVTSGGVNSTFATNGTTLTTPFDIVQAPEPSSLLLTGLGVGVLGVYRRFSRKKKAVVVES
jgi:tripartite motif-containing protein 71